MGPLEYHYTTSSNNLAATLKNQQVIHFFMDPFLDPAFVSNNNGFTKTNIFFHQQKLLKRSKSTTLHQQLFYMIFHDFCPTHILCSTYFSPITNHPPHFFHHPTSPSLLSTWLVVGATDWRESFLQEYFPTAVKVRMVPARRHWSCWPPKSVGGWKTPSKQMGRTEQKKTCWCGLCLGLGWTASPKWMIEFLQFMNTIRRICCR